MKFSNGARKDCHATKAHKPLTANSMSKHKYRQLIFDLQVRHGPLRASQMTSGKGSPTTPRPPATAAMRARLDHALVLRPAAQGHVQKICRRRAPAAPQKPKQECEIICELEYTVDEAYRAFSLPPLIIAAAQLLRYFQRFRCLHCDVRRNASPFPVKLGYRIDIARIRHCDRELIVEPVPA